MSYKKNVCEKEKLEFVVTSTTTVNWYLEDVEAGAAPAWEDT